jgi:hypothetical protein
MNKMILAGRILSGVTGVFILTSGLNVLFFQSEDLKKSFAQFGYPESAIPIIGIAALVSSVLYLIPRTKVWGAILMTGYLGGAVATHVRINDPTAVVAIIVGILVWLGLFLRDERLRAVLK